MKLFFTSLLTITLLANNANASDLVRYHDELDPMTDERNLNVAMAFEPSPVNNYGFIFQCSKGRPTFIAATGRYFHMDKKIEVTYRFDKNKAITDSFFWVNEHSSALKIDASDILESTINSNKLLVQVKNGKLMDFDLTLAHEELKKFRIECTNMGHGDTKSNKINTP